MHPHIRKISHKIRDRALIEYAKPFVAVKISHMAKAFDMDVGVVEEYLANLIADGRIEARIDSANKVVYARNADVRSATFQKALSVGTGHVRNVKSLLMRMSLADADIIVRHPEHERRVKEKSKKSDEKGAKG
jgi:COP9 signalosome complex subunit 1